MSVIFKIRSSEPRYHKYKGRIVLRGDTVKDDSGSYAVFTEQGSSASQMIAEEVMYIISRHQSCVKTPKVRMSRELHTFTNALMAKIMIQYGRLSRSF